MPFASAASNKVSSSLGSLSVSIESSLSSAVFLWISIHPASSLRIYNPGFNSGTKRDADPQLRDSTRLSSSPSLVPAASSKASLSSTPSTNTLSLHSPSLIL
ncbi:hypothetical protein PIB30_067977 [Stylosanthes scabra]|uniref:Uncharacterized protein n=1 Tax=Stylosanthes scabra TaxID=79078 RepID=A0ABU6YLK0_9FABA|nr:hypothetical protein [Stylosanthes scabra]